MDLHYKMMLSRLQGKQCFFQVGLDSNLQEKKKKKENEQNWGERTASLS